MLGVQGNAVNAGERLVGGKPVAFFVARAAVARFTVLGNTGSAVDPLYVQPYVRVGATVFFVPPSVLVEELEIERTVVLEVGALLVEHIDGELIIVSI